MINNENEEEKFENINEENENGDNKKKEENEEEDPIYVMTVELEKGKSESIKIYSNSKPEELAFSFCKKYNLDFSSLSYLSNQIKNLIENLSNGNENNNEPIEEVDEENPSSEGQSKKFISNTNSANLSPGFINNKNENQVEPNINNYYYHLFQRKINNEKGIKDNNENKFYSINSLFNRFEYKNYIMERFNIKNNNINNNNNENHKKENKSLKNINKQNINNQGNNIEMKSNLSGNIEFYKNRENIFSFQKFFDEFKNNIINKNNERDSHLYRQDSYSKRLDIEFDTENNISHKNDFILPKEKRINKTTINLDNDLTIMKNKKNFNQFLNNCNILDEIYQNKIEDASIFQIKNYQNNTGQSINKGNDISNLKSKFNFNDNDIKNKRITQLKNSNSFQKKSNNLNNNNSLTKTPPNQHSKKTNKSIPKIKNSNRNNKKNYQDYFKNNNNNNENKDSNIINYNDKNEQINENTINQNIDISFKKLFKIFDSDNDGLINILSMETKSIPITIFNLLSPIIESIKNRNKDMKEIEFINCGKKLVSNLSFNERRALFNFINNI